MQAAAAAGALRDASWSCCNVIKCCARAGEWEQALALLQQLRSGTAADSKAELSYYYMEERFVRTSYANGTVFALSPITS